MSGLSRNSKMSREQPDDPNVLDAAGDDRDTETIDSEVVTLLMDTVARLRSEAYALKYVPTDPPTPST